MPARLRREEERIPAQVLPHLGRVILLRVKVLPRTRGEDMLVPRIPPPVDHLCHQRVILRALESIGLRRRLLLPLCQLDRIRLATKVKKTLPSWPFALVHDEEVKVVVLHHQRRPASDERTHVRNNHTPPDQHQVIHPNPRPASPPRASLIAHAQLRRDLATLIEEEPDKVPLLDANNATGGVGPVVEDEWDGNFRRLDSVLHEEKLLAKCLPLGSFFPQSGLGHGCGGEDRGVCLDFVNDGIWLLVVVIVERKQFLALWLLLLLDRRPIVIVNAAGVRRVSADIGPSEGSLSSFAVLLVEDFGAAFAEVGEGDEADCVCGQSLVCCLARRSEARVGHGSGMAEDNQGSWVFFSLGSFVSRSLPYTNIYFVGLQSTTVNLHRKVVQGTLQSERYEEPMNFFLLAACLS